MVEYNDRTYRVEFLNHQKGTFEVEGNKYAVILREKEQLPEEERKIFFNRLLPTIMSYGKSAIEYCHDQYNVSPESATVTMFPDQSLEALVVRTNWKGERIEEPIQWS